MTYLDQEFASPQEALAHHGVKGMRWGVHKSESRSSDSAKVVSSKPGMSAKKKLLIGAGVLTVAAGAGYAAYSLNKNGKLPIASLKKTAKVVSAGEKAAERVTQNPTDIIHLARGKHQGLTFLQKGNTPDYFSVFDKLGLNNDVGKNFFKKSADEAGHTIARMMDPAGRVDFAGRPISHDIVIPKSMSESINSIDDVRQKIWPRLKDTYDAFYQQSLKPKY